MGTVIENNLSWDENTKEIVRKCNTQMELLRKASSFGVSVQDLKLIYILFIPSILEYCAVVWHSSLSKQNENDLERIQKTAFKIILGNKYKCYEQALNLLELEKLSERRKMLCLKFAQKAANHPRTKEMFSRNLRKHTMKTRNPETFRVHFAKNERTKNSPII